MDADKIVNSYFNNQESATKPSGSHADTIVDSYFAKQNPKPNPVDDTALNLAKSDMGDQSYNNYCEMFVEQAAYGKTGLYPDAITAWNNYAQQGKAIKGDVENAPPGSIAYFSPNEGNSGRGHTGFIDGKGNLVSATSGGVQSIPVKKWLDMTGQQPLGYILPN